jgi:hypothetical protein
VSVYDFTRSAALLLLTLATLPRTAAAQEPGQRELDATHDPKLVTVVEDIRRIGIVTGIREPRTGRLQLTVGPGFNVGAAEYHLGRLYAAYAAAHPEYRGSIVLELFRGQGRIGEYTREGLALITAPPQEVARGAPAPAPAREPPAAPPVSAPPDTVPPEAVDSVEFPWDTLPPPAEGAAPKAPAPESAPAEPAPREAPTPQAPAPEAAAAEAASARIAPPEPVPADTVPEDAGLGEALRLFVDCRKCDRDFLRTEIPFVNHVRTHHAADVLALITIETTGAGGTDYTLELIGQKQFQGYNDSLHFVTRPADTEDRIRQGLVDALKRGLVRYVNQTPYADQLEIVAGPLVGPAAPGRVRDPWNYWAFGTSLSGSINGEEAFTYISLSGSFAASRVTEQWKIIASVQGRYTENRIDLNDGSTVKTALHDYGADLLLVKSVGGHWAVGADATVTSSTFLNQRFTGRIAPAVEFNLFPYSQGTRREFTVQYSVGATRFGYEEETIFGKTEETLVDQRLLANLAMIRPWGTATLGLEAASYFHDFSKRRGIALGSLNLNLFGGFSLSLVGSAEFVRDQIYLSRAGASDEEILLRQRQLATSFRYSSSVGFRYTFGSPYANIVNTRFGGSSGGLPIVQ